MAIRKQRQVDLEFKASLVYVVSSATARAMYKILDSTIFEVGPYVMGIKDTNLLILSTTVLALMLLALDWYYLCRSL